MFENDSMMYDDYVFHKRARLGSTPVRGSRDFPYVLLTTFERIWYDYDPDFKYDQFTYPFEFMIMISRIWFWYITMVSEVRVDMFLSGIRKKIWFDYCLGFEIIVCFDYSIESVMTTMFLISTSYVIWSWHVPTTSKVLLNMFSNDFRKELDLAVI